MSLLYRAASLLLCLVAMLLLFVAITGTLAALNAGTGFGPLGLPEFVVLLTVAVGAGLAARCCRRQARGPADRRAQAS